MLLTRWSLLPSKETVNDTAILTLRSVTSRGVRTAVERGLVECLSMRVRIPDLFTGAASRPEHWQREILRFFLSLSTRFRDRELTLILRRSRMGTVWFYTSTSNKRVARPKLYTKSLTRDLKLMYNRLTLVRISINL